MAGFITGMAIQIIVGQLHGLFGIEVSGENTFAKLWSVVTQIGSWNLTATVDRGRLPAPHLRSRALPPEGPGGADAQSSLPR